MLWKMRNHSPSQGRQGAEQHQLLLSTEYSAVPDPAVLSPCSPKRVPHSSIFAALCFELLLHDL